MNCKDCKFWVLELVNDDAPIGFGSCLSQKFRTAYSNKQVVTADDEVFVEDDEGWAFFTGPLFGCVHFEKGAGKGETMNMEEFVLQLPGIKNLEAGRTEVTIKLPDVLRAFVKMVREKDAKGFDESHNLGWAFNEVVKDLKLEESK